MFGHSGGSLAGPGLTGLYQGHPPLNLHYRPLQQSDYDALKAIHHDLFPIDYEEVFFRKAVVGEDRVFSWAALHSVCGREHMVGFVTARVVYLCECDPMDRQVMGFTSKCMDADCAVYVLTLGVVPSCRQCGIARSLLALVQQHAARIRCRAVFLHVISYNDAAMRLYGASGYQARARLPNFYHLATGRQPNPEQSWYDAFLYALFLPDSRTETSAAMQWAGGMLGAAVAPLRTILCTFNGCMPTWFNRQTYSTFLPFAAAATAGTTAAPSAVTAGGGGSQLPMSRAGSLGDTATSAWQQQQQRFTLQQEQQQQQEELAASKHMMLPHHRPSPQQWQQYPLPSPAAGVVCAGVSAEHFLMHGQQQQQQQHHHSHHQQNHQQNQRCARGERWQKDWGLSTSAVVGVDSGSSSGTVQQPCKKASGSYGVNTGGGGGGGGCSSGNSSASVSGDWQVGNIPPPSLNLQPAPHQVHQQQQHQQQQSKVCGQAVLRPPSPPIPPTLSSVGGSLQHRIPHGGGNGNAEPPYSGGAGQSGNYRSVHNQFQHQHQYHGGQGPPFSAGAVCPHGRAGEHARGGINRGGQGLIGAGQDSHPLQQQLNGTLLTALFRPPGAYPQRQGR